MNQGLWPQKGRNQNLGGPGAFGTSWVGVGTGWGTSFGKASVGSTSEKELLASENVGAVSGLSKTLWPKKGRNRIWMDQELFEPVK